MEEIFRTPPDLPEIIANAYTIIRKHAPKTMVLFLSSAHDVIPEENVFLMKQVESCIGGKRDLLAELCSLFECRRAFTLTAGKVTQCRLTVK